jgi:spermidine synthase
MDDQAMAAFPRMAEVLPEAERGLARVRHLTLEGQAARQANYVAGEYIPTTPGAYALLFIKSESGSSTCMMSDLSYERSTCLEVLARAHGDVLIAGLGLGMILHPILEKPEVERVTVVEKFPDVIALISPTLPTTTKLAVVAGDIFEWTPPPGARYDVIWFDIWPDIDLARLAEMAELHRRFAPYLRAENPGCWMESWHRKESERILALTAAASV